jgi:hypothetical protein
MSAMSYLSELTTTEALASLATRNLLALLFVAVASTVPVHALPVTWFHEDSTYVSKPVRFIFERDRIPLDARAVMPPEAKCSKEVLRSTCLLQMESGFYFRIDYTVDKVEASISYGPKSVLNSNASLEALVKLAKTFGFGRYEATICLKQGIVTAEAAKATEVVHRDVVMLCDSLQLTDYIHVTFTANEGRSASRWSSERTAVIVPQAKGPEIGNVELHLLSADDRNIKVIQKTRRGAKEPDALSITVPHPFDDDQDTGLYCYLSEEESGFMQMYFTDGTNGKIMTFSSEADRLFRVFFDEVKRFTGKNEITAVNIGFGILREVPTSLLRALDAILNASGGCNYETILHLQVPPSGAVTGLNRTE